jgi:hypothetical protein
MLIRTKKISYLCLFHTTGTTGNEKADKYANLATKSITNPTINKILISDI